MNIDAKKLKMLAEEIQSYIINVIHNELNPQVQSWVSITKQIIVNSPH